MRVTSRQLSRRGIVRPQIGIDHFLIVLDCIWHALGEQFAVCQTIDFIRHIHNRQHIVFDNKQGNTKLGIGALQAVD